MTFRWVVSFGVHLLGHLSCTEADGEHVSLLKLRNLKSKSFRSLQAGEVVFEVPFAIVTIHCAVSLDHCIPPPLTNLGKLSACRP